jgi:hypothetical protein
MTLSASGLLTAISPGTGTISASSQGVSASTTATIVEITTSMTITPPNQSVIDNGTAVASYTIKDQSGNNISSLVTLTAYSALTNGTTEPDITCSYNSSDLMQDCTANSSATPGTYYMIVTYSGYTGSATVYATLNVSAS